MRKAALAVLLLAAVPALALAANSLDIGSVAGVYKYSFPNGLVDGTQFRSENVLEVVKISSTQAYIRTHLEFYNGHICTLYGVAMAEGDALVWRDPDPQDATCELRLHFSGGKVIFDDKNDVCRANWCGMRGAFNGISFPAKKPPPHYLYETAYCIQAVSGRNQQSWRRKIAAGRGLATHLPPHTAHCPE